jgi:predicted metal-binding protein
MPDTDRLDAIVRQHGISDFKWIDPKTIIVSQWVRLKCEYGCPSYGRVASCPPNTPTVQECRQFFEGYSAGLVFHVQKVAPESAERRTWSAKTNIALSKIERDVFLAGYPKAFLLFMDSCEICEECVPVRSACKEPEISRPSPEGMAVDVYGTVRQWGYPIEVLTDPLAEMDRYAFLMVE